MVGVDASLGQPPVVVKLKGHDNDIELSSNFSWINLWFEHRCDIVSFFVR